MEKDNLDVNLGDQFKVEDPSDGGRSGIHEDDEVAVILEAEGPVVFEKIKKESFEDSHSEDELGQVLTDEEEMIPSEDDDDNDEWEPTDDNEEEEEDGAQKDADYKLKQDRRTVSKMKKNEDDISKSCKNSQGKSHGRRQKPRHHICQICNKSYKIKSLLAAHHLGKHTPKEQKPFKCPLCSYGTARKSDLERHMKLVHQLAKTKDGDYVDIPKLKVPKRADKPKLERKFVCQVCGHKAFFPVHLERHMLKHSDSRPFACEYPDCKKRFRLEQHVKQHLLIHDSEQPFVCDYPGCDYRSKYQRSLNVHLVRHYPDKGLKCSTCGHISGDKTRLRLHQEVHRETLHLSCPNEDCDFRCTRQDVLRRHKMLHHNSAKIKCPHCPKVFVSEWMFRKHVDRHENGELATVAGATASLECTFCGKTCSTSYNLEQHMRTHDKNRSKKRDGIKKRPASSKKKSTVPSEKKNQVANEPVIKAEVDYIKVESNPSESCDLKTENLGTHVDVDMKMIQTSQACASVFSLIGNSSS